MHTALVGQDWHACTSLLFQHFANFVPFYLFLLQPDMCASIAATEHHYGSMSHVHTLTYVQ